MVYALIFFLFTSKNSYFKVYFKEQIFLHGSTYIKIVSHFYVQECVSVAIFFSHDTLDSELMVKKALFHVDWIKGPIDLLMRFNTSHCGQRQIVKNDREWGGSFEPNAKWHLGESLSVSTDCPSTGSPDRVGGFTAAGLCKHRETARRFMLTWRQNNESGDNNSVRGRICVRMCIHGAAALCFRAHAACGIV